MNEELTSEELPIDVQDKGLDKDTLWRTVSLYTVEDLKEYTKAKTDDISCLLSIFKAKTEQLQNEVEELKQSLSVSNLINEGARDLLSDNDKLKAEIEEWKESYNDLKEHICSLTETGSDLIAENEALKEGIQNAINNQCTEYCRISDLKELLKTKEK